MWKAKVVNIESAIWVLLIAVSFMVNMRFKKQQSRKIYFLEINFAVLPEKEGRKIYLGYSALETLLTEKISTGNHELVGKTVKNFFFTPQEVIIRKENCTPSPFMNIGAELFKTQQ